MKLLYSILGAHVVMANRNIIQSEQLRDKIYAEYPDVCIFMY